MEEILSLLHPKNRWKTNNQQLTKIIEDLSSAAIINNTPPLALLKILLTVISIAKTNYENERAEQLERPAKERMRVYPPHQLYERIKNLAEGVCRPLGQEVYDLITALYSILSDGPPNFQQTEHAAVTVANPEMQKTMLRLHESFPTLMLSDSINPATKAFLQTLLSHALSELLLGKYDISTLSMSIQTLLTTLTVEMDLQFVDAAYNALQEENRLDVIRLLNNDCLATACNTRVQDVTALLTMFLRVQPFQRSLSQATILSLLSENGSDYIVEKLRSNLEERNNPAYRETLLILMNLYLNLDRDALFSLKHCLATLHVYNSGNFSAQVNAQLRQWLNILDGQNFLLQDLCRAVNSRDIQVINGAVACLRKHQQLLRPFCERIIGFLSQAIEADSNQNNRTLLTEVRTEFERLNPQPIALAPLPQGPINPFAQAAPGNLLPAVPIGGIFMGAQPVAQPLNPFTALFGNNAPPPPAGRGNTL